MDFYRRLQALGQGPRNADEEHPSQADQFARRDIGQIISTPGTAQRIVQKNPRAQGKLGFFPIPGKTAHRAGSVFTGGSDLVIPANTGDRASAVARGQALAGEKWNTELARTMNYVPSKTTLERRGRRAGRRRDGRRRRPRQRRAPAPWQGDGEAADNPIKAYMSQVLSRRGPGHRGEEGVPHDHRAAGRERRVTPGGPADRAAVGCPAMR